MKTFKKIISLVLTIAIISNFSSLFSVGAVQKSPTITYDGNVKILSNIPSQYLNSEKRKRSKSTAIEDFFLEIGYTEEQVASLSDEDINDYINAETIYAISKEVVYSEGTYTTIDDPINVTENKFNAVFSVIELSNKINGKIAFRIKTVVDWNSCPVWRLKDIIAMAWTSNALTAGTARSSFSMTYDKAVYANNQQTAFYNDMDATAACEEVNYFPGYAVEYDIPGDTPTAYYYSDFHLVATTTVTASDDFSVCSGYGHQIIAGNPSVSVNTDSAGVGLSFNYVMDDFYFGIIRVYFK